MSHAPISGRAVSSWHLSGVRSAGPGSVASSHPCSLSSAGGRAQPGIVCGYKNKGILAWALLAEGRRGQPWSRPEGHLAGKGASPSSTTSKAGHVGGPPRAMRGAGVWVRVWVLAALSLQPLKSVSDLHQRLPTT